MQDAFASVAPDGAYSSPIPSVSARFGTMVGGLTTGRMLIGAPDPQSTPSFPNARAQECADAPMR